MSYEIAIRVDRLSKCYQIYAKPQDRLKQSLWRGRKQFFREFWALRDISFEVKKGEMVGIIGRNGSGKSTLLQIICGTLAPTSGEVETHGRVAALLELGAGFNPEFTGRENVYLNGSILGLRREEVDARYDEIVSFADIGDFIEQPVKTYSSGMFVRLAFAVQACVEPDILVVDEALAVGDVFFRQKCYRRLAALREKGCSIILVTHAMNDVEQFCERALLLHQGEAVFQGGASEAVRRYYLIEQKGRESAFVPETAQLSNETSSAPSPIRVDTSFWPAPDAFLDIASESQVSNGWARCTGVALCDNDGRPCRSFRQGATISFFYEFELLRDIEVPIGGLTIQNDKGTLVHGKSTLEYRADVPVTVRRGDRLRFRQEITLEIAPGEYVLSELGLAAMSKYDFDHQGDYSYAELSSKWIRLCYLHNIGSFAVFPLQGLPLHHGVVNLPGECSVTKFSERPGLGS